MINSSGYRLRKFLQCIVRPLFFLFKYIPLSIILALIASVAPICIGYNLSVYNTSFNIIAADMGWSSSSHLDELAKEISFKVYCDNVSNKQFFIISTFFLWAALGSLCSKYFLAKFGRRMSLIIINSTFFVCSIFSAISINFGTMYFFRSLTGLTSGMATVIPAIFMNEMALPEYHAIVSYFPQIGLNFGVLLGIFSGYLLRPPTSSATYDLIFNLDDWNFNRHWWRVMMILPAPFALFSALTLVFPFSFETPLFLRATGRHYEAAKAEKVIRRPYELLEDDEETGNESLPSVPTTIGLEMQNAKIPRYSLPENSGSTIASLRKIFTYEGSKYNLIIGWIFSVFQQFTGIIAFYTSSNSLFERLGVPPSELTRLSVNMAVINLVCAVCAPFALRTTKRRHILMFGGFGMGFSMYIIVFASVLQIEFLEAYTLLLIDSAVIIYGLTLGPGLLIYLNELFQAEIRDTGLSIAYALNWLASFAVLALTPLVEYDTFYAVCSTVCFLTGVIASKFSPETLALVKKK